MCVRVCVCVRLSVCGCGRDFGSTCGSGCLYICVCVCACIFLSLSLSLCLCLSVPYRGVCVCRSMSLSVCVCVCVVAVIRQSWRAWCRVASPAVLGNHKWAPWKDGRVRQGLWKWSPTKIVYLGLASRYDHAPHIRARTETHSHIHSLFPLFTVRVACTHTTHNHTHTNAQHTHPPHTHTPTTEIHNTHTHWHARVRWCGWADESLKLVLVWIYYIIYGVYMFVCWAMVTSADESDWLMLLLLLREK